MVVISYGKWGAELARDTIQVEGLDKLGKVWYNPVIKETAQNECVGIGGKGAKLCVSTEKEKTWLQCTNCGRIHIVERKIPMERSIVNSHCERCGYNRALNCGYSEEDVAEMQDYFLDERYF